ncbi:hypothetical protein ABZ719_24005, partial [Streptomyces sp. NPDC006743]
ALSVAGKAGKVIDPMTYVAKGAGAGLSKIGDISKALKGMGKIDIPELPQNAITLPKGTVKLPDGSFHLPEGAPVPEGATRLPSGSFKLPDDVPVVHDGAHPLHTPEGTGQVYGHPDGHIVDGHGNILIHADELDPPATGTGPAGSDLPHTPTPAREPALLGAGTHTAADSAAHAGEHLHLHNTVDTDLAETGHLADDTHTPPTVHAGGEHIPTVHAGGEHIPTSHAGGEHLPGGHAPQHTPSGHADDHLPGGNAHEHGPGPSASHESPSSHGSGHGNGGHAGGGATEGGASGAHEPVASGGHGETTTGGGEGGSVAGVGDGSGTAGREGGTPPGQQPPPVNEWPASDDVKGSARGKTLLYPNSRHDLSGIRGGVPKEENTVILPETKAEVRHDISEIAAGRAEFDPESQRYTVNGRRYAVEPSGRIFPVDGPGFIQMDRVEYSALKSIMRADGDLSKVQTMFSKAPQFRENPQAVEKAIALYRKYYA